jgi:hypothetical protein
MAPDIDRIVAHLTSVVTDHHDSQNADGYLEPYDARRVGTRARAAIQRFAPPESPYTEDAEHIGKNHDQAADSWIAEQLVS